MTKKSSQIPLPAYNYPDWAAIGFLIVNVEQATLPHKNSNLASILDNFAKKGHLK